MSSELGNLTSPQSIVDVVPSLPFGASSLRLAFTGGWTGVDISYTAEADAPWIRQFNLLFLIGGSGVVGASGTPGGDLSVIIDSFPIIDIRLFDTQSFDLVSLTTIHISGSSPSHPFGGVNSFAFDVVTPEPATFLLWGAGAAGLSLARWRRHREDRAMLRSLASPATAGDQPNVVATTDTPPRGRARLGLNLGVLPDHPAQRDWVEGFFHECGESLC